MTIIAKPKAGLPACTMAALMLAVFTVSVGFSVILPLLPNSIERLLGASVEANHVSRHTGFLTGIYTLSLFLFSAIWGRLSDRRGPRGVLIVGLLGFGVAIIAFPFVERLAGIYAERFLSGMFAAAITPVAAAVVGSFIMNEQERARRLTFMSMASIAGFLLGPMLSVSLTSFAATLSAAAMPAGLVPLTATALLASFAAFTVAFTVPAATDYSREQETLSASSEKIPWLLPKLLILTFIVSASIGSFEVGLALRGKQELNLTPYQIALLFTECSLIMFLFQSAVFLPWFRPDKTRWIVAPALSMLAIGLFLVPQASNFGLMQTVIGAVAASAGILSPILTYWISAKAGTAQGWELGKQTAAASLGSTLGSTAGGLFYNISAFSGASFILPAALTSLGFVLSLGLPYSLAATQSMSRRVSNKRER